MRALLQRVSSASVRVGDKQIAGIGPGLVVLLGVGQRDEEQIADALAQRIADLRIFVDEAGRTNRSVLEVGGDVIVVSQFTLYADTSRGRRPGFTDAGPAELAERLYWRVARRLTVLGIKHVETGRFGAKMAVELVNDGPFTLWLDTDARQMGAPRT